MDFLLQLSRILVYMFMLVSSGMVLINTIMPLAVTTQRNNVTVARWFMFACRGFIISALASMFVQVLQWTSQFGNDAVSLLWESTTGKVYVAIFVGSILIAFIRHSLIKLLMVLIVLLAESINGHAAESNISILFDFIHLAAIAIWVGGILYVYFNWKDGKAAVVSFLDKYMKWLWLSIAVVSVSGILLAIFILPDISYLIYTRWGQLLLIKAAVVGIVMWVGYLAKRYALDKQGLSVQDNLDKTPKTLIAEMITLAVVIVIAGSISSISTSPSAENTLYTHQMGEELHYTIKLTPNAPGPNLLSVSLWTLEEAGSIDGVKLTLQAMDKRNAEARTYELIPIELEEYIEFPGFIESRFGLEELRLPYPTSWNGQVEISYEDGSQQAFDFEFTN